MKRRVRVLVVVGVLAAIGAGYYWGYYVPSQQVAGYRGAIDERENDVRRSAEELVKVLALPVFSDLTEKPDVCGENLDNARETAATLKRHVDGYEQALGYDRPVYIYGLTREYAQANARHQHARSAINQTRQVVEKYEAMMDFLSEMTSVRAEQLEVTARLASVSDLNIFAGRSNELRGDADKLEKLAAQLDAAQPPVELAPLREKMLAYYRELAIGYTDLAGGVETAIDDAIYAAARRIELATEKYYRDLPAEYTAIMQASATLKDLEELPDKFMSS